MGKPSLEHRVKILEDKVEDLQQLPQRMTDLELQLLELRTEMRSEFSAIRRDMVVKADLERFATKADLGRFATKADLEPFATKADLEQLRGELGATRVDLDAVAAELSRFEAVTLEEFSRVRQEIRDGDEETRRFMRVLHEEVLERIAWLGEGVPGTKKARRRKH